MKQVFGNIWDSDVDVVCILTNGTVTAQGTNIMGGGIAAEAVNKVRLQNSVDLAFLYGRSIKRYGHTLRSLGRFYPLNKELLAFPTKYDISEPADLGLIENSLNQLFTFSDIYPEKKIGLPRPGSGLGGLNWQTQVKPLLEAMFEDNKRFEDKRFEDRIIIFGYANEA